MLQKTALGSLLANRRTARRAKMCPRKNSSWLRGSQLPQADRRCLKALSPVCSSVCRYKWNESSFAENLLAVWALPHYPVLGPTDGLVKRSSSRFGSASSKGKRCGGCNKAGCYCIRRGIDPWRFVLTFQALRRAAPPRSQKHCGIRPL
jgi:hypothetical protein